MLHVLHAGIFLLDANMKSVLLFHSLVTIQAMQVLTWSACKGTLVAVPTQANICVGTLNKGGSGDPGTQSAVGHPTQIQVVSDIYTRDHSRCYLLIVTLLT
jgi:hypothetical protein